MPQQEKLVRESTLFTPRSEPLAGPPVRNWPFCYLTKAAEISGQGTQPSVPIGHSAPPNTWRV